MAIEIDDVPEFMRNKGAIERIVRFLVIFENLRHRDCRASKTIAQTTSPTPPQKKDNGRSGH